MASKRPSKSVAKPERASRLLLARTDGRTNERTTHHKETSHLLNRAGDISPESTSADIAFTNYLATVDVAKFSDYEWRLYKYLRLQVMPS